MGILNHFMSLVGGSSRATVSQSPPPGAVIGTARICPYCGERIDLVRCDVVSTAGAPKTDGATHSDRVFDNVGDADPAETPHGDSSASHYPILLAGNRDDEDRSPRTLRDELSDLTGNPQPLVRLNSVAPPALIPRRTCENCSTPLPPELDTRTTRLLAIAGINHAGKTHFLAQAAYEASRKGALRRFGCTEFFPTETDETARTMHNSYYARLHHEHRVLDATPEQLRPKQLTFAATLDGAPMLLVTHDVSGEAMAESTRRATEMGFLRRADALIFLLDPLEFDAVRVRVPATLAGEYRPAYQVDLLRQCLIELRETRGAHIPIRVVISKADLLRDYCGIEGLWQRPHTDDWATDLAEVSADVCRILVDLGETEVLQALAPYERVRYHAVSALGAAPDGEHIRDGVPIRCSDPLGAALYGMVHPPSRSS